MNFEEHWQKAIKHTEIIRARIQALHTLQETKVPYILLSESSINHGDTVVREGEVLIQRPTLIIPPNNPQFEGFDFSEPVLNDSDIINFFIMRGVSFPSLKYDNKTSSLDVFEGGLTQAIKHYEETLKRNENVQTGLIAGPEDCWQFSLLIFICSQILRNADTDIRKFLQDFKKFKE